MPLVTSRIDLNQGQSNSVAGAIFATGTGADIRIHTSASNNLPALAAGEFFEVRDAAQTNNNGLYQVVTVSTSTDDYECDKVFGSAPTTAGSQTITTLGATGASLEKSVFVDTAGLGVAILEQGNVDSAGVTGQAIYSFLVQEYKDDDFLIANAPFPMLAIDSDAGKYIIGQDPSGNTSGFTFLDSIGFSIRTRKLLRNMGWNEVDSTGKILGRYVGTVTLGDFEDSANDTAYYYFGNDTTVDNTTDFDFAGPVNEAVQFYTHIGDLSGDTPSFASTSTITRATGSFITDGFVVGGQVTVINSTSNDGTYVLTGVSATTLTVTGTPLTVEAWGTAEIAVDNDNAYTLGLRIRDGDAKGKTFSQANIASAGRTVLGNFVYAFPLANASDQKIDATDANITGNTPYTGMSITYHSSPQSKSGLVGGSYNFGIVIDGNNGTAQEVYEFVQYQLRQTTDIDADADTAIGRAMDLLMRFVGDSLEVGSADGGLTFPSNPDGGGSGVFIDNLNAASKNDVTFFDNTGTARSFPETIPITLDFNQTLIDDTVAEFDLFFDRTIRTNVTDFVISTGPDKITSAGTNLPTNAEIAVGAYVRVSGLTAGDAAMNGVYQITAINSAGADWGVIRYDGATIVAVSSTTANIDQNCIDTPDAIIVRTDVNVIESASNITYTAPDTISDSNSGLGVFASGDIIEITGSTSNDGIYEVDTVAAGSITLIEQTIATEGSSSSSELHQLASGLASADYTFSFDFDGNTQGGRTVSTNTYVKGKAIGAATAQYTESTVQTIQSGTPLTIPLTSQQERNYV
jgi:hypothetical protein